MLPMLIAVVVLVSSEPMTIKSEVGIMLLPPAGLGFLVGVLPLNGGQAATWCCRFFAPLSAALSFKTLCNLLNFKVGLGDCLAAGCEMPDFYCYWRIVQCALYIVPIAVPALILGYQDVARASVAIKGKSLWFCAGFSVLGVAMISMTGWCIAILSGEYGRSAVRQRSLWVTPLRTFEYVCVGIFCIMPDIRKHVHMVVVSARGEDSTTKAERIVELMAIEDSGPQIRIVGVPARSREEAAPFPRRASVRTRIEQRYGKPDLLEPDSVESIMGRATGLMPHAGDDT